MGVTPMVTDHLSKAEIFDFISRFFFQIKEKNNVITYMYCEKLHGQKLLKVSIFKTFHR